MRDGMIYSLSSPIPIGREGENEAREVAIDICQLVRKWPELTPQLLAKRPGEADPYPCRTRVEDGVLIWEITDSDTAISGMGECVIHMVGDGGVIGKSRIARTVIKADISGAMQETPPPAIKPWVNSVLTEIEDVKSGYVPVDQGEENAGMALVVGGDGRVTVGKGGGLDEAALFDALNRWGVIQSLQDGDGAYIADADGAVITY